MNKAFVWRIQHCGASSSMIRQRIAKLDAALPVTILLLGLNGVVFICWQVAIAFNFDNLRPWMIANFCCPIEKRLRKKRPHAVLFSAFSHISANHFLKNMAVLCGFIPSVYRQFQSTPRI